MQPIETIYKGYRFRSRLEARWAVFLDAMGIQWEYEKEGYVLSNKTRYLPDFWLPEDKCFLEVKPYNLGDDEINKCELLSIHSVCDVILAVGLPEPKPYIFLTPYVNTKNNDDVEVFPEYYFILRHDGRVGNWESAGGLDWISDDESLVSACLTAKQARFEFGGGFT